MFTVTEQAAGEVRKSIDQGKMTGLALRIAASRKSDGSIEYRMGFDDIGKEDLHLTSQGIDVVIAREDKELLSGTVMDYVEIEPGEFRFIFMNPNDPNYRPPTES